MNLITIFLCGDAMLGRGIDQIMPLPSDPVLHEHYVKSAMKYVELAEEVNGPIPRPVDFSYIWGDALEELKRVAPDVRVVNLETSITRSNEYWAGKPVHYRMNPQNVPCIKTAGIDCCSLANNHVLDWGYPGLLETLDSLQREGIKTSGAGKNSDEAEAAAVVEVTGKGRCIMFSSGSTTSGVPVSWAAAPDRPGVNLLGSDWGKAAQETERRIRQTKRPGDVVVVSIHWGSNWGYEIPGSQREFAHNLIQSGADVIYGHSSHHIKGIEVYMDRLILYGCGDFLNDYDGIRDYEQFKFRGDLGLMYLASIEVDSGRLASLEMTPTQVRRFRVNRAESRDADWLRDTLNRQGARFGTYTELSQRNALTLRW